MNYVEHHFGDYAKDTAHLSMIEHGAYRLLIDVYYVREKPLPSEVIECCRLVRAAKAPERKAVEAVLKEYFDLTAAGWTHKRCEHEIARYRDKQEKAKKSAAARWNSSEEEGDLLCEGNANAFRMQSDGNAPSNQSPVTSNQKRLSPAYAGSPNSDELGFQKTRLSKVNGSIPTCPFEAIAEAYHQELPELPSIVVLSPNRKRTLQARWREVCASDHLDRDAGLTFFRDFFKRIRQSQFLLGKTPPKRPGERSFRADFDWIFNAANFVKIVEGRYHQRPH